MTVKARTIDSLDLTCPDDIWENLINLSYPKLPYLVLDNYDRDGGDMKTKINLPVVVQESTRLKAIYSLNQGGKMLSLFDKKLNCMEDVKKIANDKMADLNAVDIEGAINMVKGSAVSMGMEVVV